MNSHQPSGPVVVGIDGSKAALSAVRFAAHEAEGRGTSLRLVHVISPHPQPEAVYGAPDVDADYGHTVLQEAVEAATDVTRSVLVESIVLHGQPESEISIEAKAACLLVVGTNAENAAAERVLGSVARSLVESSACPVAVVRESQVNCDGAVVVAVGDGDASPFDPVVAEAFREALTRSTDIEAVHTRSISELFGHELGSAVDGMHPESSMDIRLARFAEDYPTVRVVSIYAEASAGPELVAVSKTAQLVVAGHQRGRVCGSTLTALLRHAKSPVLIVPHA